MDYLYYLFVVCGFLAVVLGLEGVFLMWNSYRGPEAQKIERRLRSVSAGAQSSQETALLKKRVMSDLPELDRMLLRLPRARRLDRLLQQAGADMTVSTFLAMSVLFGLIGLLLPFVLRLPPSFGLLLAIPMASVPGLYMMARRRRRFSQFERQLPDVLDLIARALRAGHSFASGIEMVAQESPEPSAGEFRITTDEINFGISVNDALLNLAQRMPSTDLKYFVVAVLIQRETGGNLAELLDKLASLIRQRFRLFEKVRALSAEGRLSGWILGCMPFFVALILNFINPQYLSKLWDDPAGVNVLIGALVFTVLGALWMRKIIRIRV